MFNLIPREGKFFDLFRDSANLIVEGSVELRELLKDLKQAEDRTHKIKALEHRADEVTHQAIDLLHKTFITPMDRDDIHWLVTRMDDIMDYLEEASIKVSMYGITKVNPEVNRLADLCVQSAEAVGKAVQHLENLKNPSEIVKTCVDINRLENEADQVLREGLAKLFREENDLKQLIKLKEVMESLENATDRCEDVANIIEGIVLEYA
jgi:predicted phosphate transport protein (TIGR00153 family)